ncbi:MAG TPA: hypothetical protein VHN98_04260 [Acidimicrobiales bacterium]|nr:hypothetical protein [Acidimicrobiales bacterium]
MGQPIAVTRKPSNDPSVARFEINRTLTGMGHERYDAGAEIVGDRPPDELARRLFAKGGVRRIHIYSNMISLDLEPDADADGYEDVIRDLYIHYKPGVEPSYSA